MKLRDGSTHAQFSGSGCWLLLLLTAGWLWLAADCSWLAADCRLLAGSADLLQFYRAALWRIVLLLGGQ
jgi:hypothetical protein